MIAVIKTGGKQYLVKPGDKITIEKLDIKEGGEVMFPDVLMFQNGETLEIGNPAVKGVNVAGKVLGHVKGEKLIIFKYKPKKRYKRKIGHRQKHTEVQIISIS